VNFLITISFLLDFFELMGFSKSSTDSFDFRPDVLYFFIKKQRMGGWACEIFPGGINIANRTTKTYSKYFDFQRPKTFK